jgi:hypothetical protein
MTTEAFVGKPADANGSLDSQGVFLGCHLSSADSCEQAVIRALKGIVHSGSRSLCSPTW